MDNSFLFAFLPTICCLVTRNNTDYLLSNHHDNNLFPLKICLLTEKWRCSSLITKSDHFGQNLPFTELSVLLKRNSLKHHWCKTDICSPWPPSCLGASIFLALDFGWKIGYARGTLTHFDILWYTPWALCWKRIAGKRRVKITCKMYLVHFTSDPKALKTRSWVYLGGRGQSIFARAPLLQVTQFSGIFVYHS